MTQLRSSVDQWQVLAAVVDEGGFAQAVARLHRSQSAISYALAQLQESLGVRLLEMQGRRAVHSYQNPYKTQLSPGRDTMIRLDDHHKPPGSHPALDHSLPN